ncbi:MAG TPA: transketolase [Symbiobacteriaceae bacterium]|nr:transketolase [Symbiobacteriaceae bacterium]
MAKPNLTPELRQACVNTIKMLAVDAVEKAKSGHPGAPMGCADMAFVLWTQFLRFDPDHPQWPNRDRFILSNGHASMLLYSLLHLTGYDLPIEQLQQFRQWGSRTPGHPEFGHTPGVEVTTGPLGQGLAHAVGMAAAAEMMAARFAAPEFSPVDHYIYGICGDGDLQEGVASEAASLAGHWKLGRLIFLYDSNKISIEGDTDVSFTEDVGKRFEAYGWHVQKIEGHDHGQIAGAITKAQQVTDKPSLIIARTTIGKGSPNKGGKESSHGAPLGADEVRLTKEALGWPAEPTFLVPDAVRAYFSALKQQKQAEHKTWQEKLAAWRHSNPEMAADYEAFTRLLVPADLDEQLVKAVEGATNVATRKLSEMVIQKAAALVPNLVGGSADLSESNLTYMKGQKDVGPCAKVGHYDCTWAGRNFHFGVREHAMGSIVNGIFLYGGFRPYGATFMVFANYMLPPLRLAALMGIPSIFVFTHDSFFVGEDGPTHQPIETLWQLRLIPHLTLFRPADGLETAMAWAYALMAAKEPVTLALTRHNLPALARPEGFKLRDVWKGAYVMADGTDATVIATGSEVSVALEARKLLAEQGIHVRVVSMPSVSLFLAQPAEYREQVLGPRSQKVAAIEAGAPDGWYRFTGSDGLVIGMEDFGASAPAAVLAEKFGFVPAKVVARIQAWLGKQ